GEGRIVSRRRRAAHSHRQRRLQVVLLVLRGMCRLEEVDAAAHAVVGRDNQPARRFAEEPVVKDGMQCRAKAVRAELRAAGPPPRPSEEAAWRLRKYGRPLLDVEVTNLACGESQTEPDRDDGAG